MRRNVFLFLCFFFWVGSLIIIFLSKKLFIFSRNKYKNLWICLKAVYTLIKNSDHANGLCFFFEFIFKPIGITIYFNEFRFEWKRSIRWVMIRVSNKFRYYLLEFILFLFFYLAERTSWNKLLMRIIIVFAYTPQTKNISEI